ncbi:MAG: diaminopimelate decarboxylase, partial [Chloroflexi bacterium]|nr:diaminopimelate decarboxylase [Chloroflexota bacterium]
MDLVGVLPTSARVNAVGHLEIGGADTVALASELGTPLYVFCEAELRERARAYTRTLAEVYPDSQVLYATKAWSNVALLRLLAGEGLGFDVVSGGELYAVKRAGATLGAVYFHGNNKS